MDFLSLLLMLVVDTSASWIRMFAALFISVFISIFVGIYAATNARAERIILPVVDVLQTIPILAFFPFAIFVFVFLLPGYIGINAAVIFLIVTSMLWNIIFGVYESVKTMPKEFIELADMYHFDFWSRLRRIYVPASMPRIVQQSILSWAIGLFYLVTSEIFSTGNVNYHVTYGIGSVLPSLAGTSYIMAIGVFVAFVVATRFLFFRPLEKYSTRYMRGQSADASAVLPRYEKRVLDWIGHAIPRNREVFDSAGFAVTRSGKGTARKPAIHKNTKDMSSYYRIMAVLMAAAIIYVIASNRILLGYELEVIPALAASFARIWIAFIVILAVAVPVGIYLIFMTKKTSSYILLFQVLASIPATILLPLIAETFVHGSTHGGEYVAFVIFFLSGIWYVIFGIMASTRTLPENMFEVKKIFGVKGSNAWKNIYLKAILPGLITGAITGIAAEWNASIVAEYFTTTGVSGSQVISSVGIGIGRLLDTAISSGGLVLMAVALLNLVVMIILINTFVWKKYYRSIAKMYG
ncbi:MAG: ABC transporter permease subunit [Candidatus Marsarchaeota archaeon]|nr:ABC transporter permease subunit [Candidatus Marsarchaeota archaeon]MCL5413552.1 ABC transporter permease subunit [Candidatus Marsarchaeota archaeon]